MFFDLSIGGFPHIIWSRGNFHLGDSRRFFILKITSGTLGYKLFGNQGRCSFVTMLRRGQETVSKSSTFSYFRRRVEREDWQLFDVYTCTSHFHSLCEQTGNTFFCVFVTSVVIAAAESEIKAVKLPKTYIDMSINLWLNRNREPKTSPGNTGKNWKSTKKKSSA